MKEEWDLSRTRRGPVPNKKQRRDSSSTTTNSTIATHHLSPHTTTNRIPINNIYIINNTPFPWRKSTVGPWRGTRHHLQWSTANNRLRIWASLSVPACTMARCKMEIQELEQGVRLPCPVLGGKERPSGQWGVGGAVRADIWGPALVAALKRE